MNKFIVSVMILGLLCFAGCAWLNKVAPNQVDASGNIISGTHQVPQTTQDVAAMIPYGSVGLNGFLLVWNFIERAKSKKTASGLMATVRAIKQASDDPDIQAAAAKLKEYLRINQQAVGVQSLIKDYIAKT
jgi:hypothetical protein